MNEENLNHIAPTSDQDPDISRRTLKKLKKARVFFDDKIKQLEDEKFQLALKIDSMKKQQWGSQQLTNSDKKEVDLEHSDYKEILSEYDKVHKEYADAQKEREQIEQELFPFSSSMSSYGSEIILFSVVIGLIFDFLLWKDIFAGKFGTDSWAERSERASAVIMSFSYAVICSQLGASYAIKVLSKKRIESSSIKEMQIYRKSTAKDTFGVNIFLFSIITALSTLARFTQKSLSISDQLVLSMAATSIGLVISAIAYWYTDVYEHFIKLAKNKEVKAKRNFYRLNKKKVKEKYDI
jgi:hypothetical protein